MGQISLSDKDCREFLVWLGDNKRYESKLDDRERGFIEANREREKFSDKQKVWVRGLINKYPAG